MNAPPSSGTMTVTTTGGGEPIGMVMKDTFDLTCSGWVDDVSDLPLIYRCHVASRHVGRNKCAALSGFTITPPLPRDMGCQTSVRRRVCLEPQTEPRRRVGSESKSNHTGVYSRLRGCSALVHWVAS